MLLNDKRRVTATSRFPFRRNLATKKCRERNCGRSTHKTSQFCVAHTCTFRGCFNNKQADMAGCRRHSCGVARCDLLAKSGRYCKYHTCYVHGCDSFRERMKDGCKRHHSKDDLECLRREEDRRVEEDRRRQMHYYMQKHQPYQPHQPHQPHQQFQNYPQHIQQHPHYAEQHQPYYGSASVNANANVGSHMMNFLPQDQPHFAVPGMDAFGRPLYGWS